jgi:hypothetical protein
MAQKLDNDALFYLKKSPEDDPEDIPLSKLIPHVTSIANEKELSDVVDSIIQGWYDYMHEVRWRVLEV